MTIWWRKTSRSDCNLQRQLTILFRGKLRNLRLKISRAKSKLLRIRWLSLRRTNFRQSKRYSESYLQPSRTIKRTAIWAWVRRWQGMAAPKFKAMNKTQDGAELMNRRLTLKTRLRCRAAMQRAILTESKLVTNQLNYQLTWLTTWIAAKVIIDPF